MSKVIKKLANLILHTLSGVVLAIILLILALALALSLPRVQSFVASEAMNYLSEEVGVELSIGAISIENLARLTAEDIFVEDLEGDTLLWVGKASGRINRKALFEEGKLLPSDVKAKNVVMNLTDGSEKGSNIDNLIKHISEHFPSKNDSESVAFAIEGVELENMVFRLYDDRYAGRTPEGVIDYSDMDLKIATAHFERIAIEGSTLIISGVDNLNVRDISGAELKNSSLGALTIGSALLDFRDVDFYSGATHLSLPYLIIKGESWEDYSDFCDKVTLTLYTHKSTLEPSTAGKFVAELGQYAIDGTDITGIFEGTVCDFGADISAKLYDSEVVCICEVKELLHFDSLTADVDLYLNTTPTKVENIIGHIAPSALPAEAKEWLDRLATLTIDGRIGYREGEITADALLATDLGDVELDGLLTLEGNNVAYDGTIAVSNLNAGALLQVDNLGTADLNASGKVSFAQGTLRGSASARVERFGWNNYDYGNLSLEASLNEGILTAAANSTDPNIAFTLEAESNTSTTTPEYNLILNVERADFSALGIAKSNTNSWLSGNVEASLKGATLDDMVGRAMVNNLVYASATDTLSTELVNISLAGGKQAKTFSLFSPIANIEYHSTASYNDVADYLTKTLPGQLPLALAPQKEQSSEEVNEGENEESYGMGSRLYAADDYTSIVVNIKEGEALAAVLLPDANLAPDSSLGIEFSPTEEEFALNLESDYIAISDVVVSELRIESTGKQKNISLLAESNEILAMGMAIPDVGLEATAGENNKVNLSLFFSNPDTALSGNLNIDGTIARDSRNQLTASASIADSYLLSPESRWDISARRVDYTPEHIGIDGFRLGNQNEEVTISGEISDSKSSPLNININNLSTAQWLSLLTSTKMAEAVLDGRVELYSTLNEPFGSGALVASGINVGGVEIDPMELDVEIPRGSTRAEMSITNNYVDSTLARADYDYKAQEYNAEVSINHFDLSLLGQLLEGIVSDTSGDGKIALSVAGGRNQLNIDGGIELADLNTKVGYTGANYSAKSLAIEFDDNKGTIAPTRIEDGEGGWAEVEGYIDLGDLNAIDYGITLVPHNLVAIDLEEGNPNGFYGKVFASGGAKLTSSRGSTDISGAIEAVGGSVFNLPLTGNNDFAGAEFVSFVDRSQFVAEDTTHLVTRKKNELLNKKKRHKAPTANTTIDLMLGVDTDTQLRIIIDPETDNALEARGVADLGITLDKRKNDLSIRGDYQISEGVYNFNFQNLITKQFTINPDSYIRWNGDPLDASIDVGATYKLKTSLAPLLGSGSTASRASTPVECIVNFTGQLSKVDVSFDINVPTANTEYQSILSSYFSSQEMMATQFVYLLALGNFYSDVSAGATTTASAAGTAIGLDFLANQVSKLVSNDAYKFNLKYKAIDDTSSSYSVDFQTAIIDDRLLLELEANVDTGDSYQAINGDNNQLSGGGAITLLLDNSGDFYIKGFSRTIDRFDENQGLQESGVGIYFRRNFDKWSDLWRSKKKSNVPEEENKKSDTFVSPSASSSVSEQQTDDEQQTDNKASTAATEQAPTEVEQAPIGNDQ